MRASEAASFFLTHTHRQFFNRLKAEIYRDSPVVHYSPCSLSIDVTTACNLDCPWCSTKRYRNENTPQHLSLSRAEELLDRFKTATFVGFCGAGETLLNPDLFAMAEYANQLNMRVLIATNGTILPARMDELLDSNIHTLEISLKGICDEEYQQLIGRRKFKFSSILDAVRDLSKSHGRPRLEMSYVCDKQSVHNIPSVLTLANQCGVDEVYFYNLIPDPVLGNESECLFEDNKQWVLKILNSSLIASSKMVVSGPGFYSRDSHRRRCKEPFRSLRVGPDGGVSGCGRAINPSLENGNAFVDNDIFNTEHFKKLRAEHLDNTQALRYECLYCNNRC